MRKTGVFAALALMLAGCSFHIEAGDFSRYPGSEVAQLANRRWKPLLLAQSPQLKAGDVVCPATLDIADGRAAYCSIPVNGQRLRLRVTLKDDEPYVKGIGSVFFTDVVERSGRTFGLIEYGLDAPVRCGPPRARVVEPGQRFSCLWEVPGHPQEMEFEGVDSSGRFKVLPVAHMAKLVHKLAWQKGGVLRLEGSTIARAMDLSLQNQNASIRIMWPDLVEGLELGRTRCPAEVTLTSKRQPVCSLRVNGITIAVDGWTGGGTWHVATDKIFFPALGLSKNTEAAIARMAAAQGDMTAVHVDCGRSGIVAMAPGDTILCRYRHGTLDGHVRIETQADGRYVFRIED
jgi:hypothetical protein